MSVKFNHFEDVDVLYVDIDTDTHRYLLKGSKFTQRCIHFMNPQLIIKKWEKAKSIHCPLSTPCMPLISKSMNEKDEITKSKPIVHSMKI